MKIAIHDISVSNMVDSESCKLRVEYTPENGSTTIDYGTYNIRTNTYWPNIDPMNDTRADELYELQTRVENRG
jgi:hypothetical protein